MVSTTRAYSDSRTEAHPGMGYDGVVYISNGSRYGTGVLLADGRHLLTAAHLAQVADLASYAVYFQTKQGTVKYSVTGAQIYGEYDAANGNGDLAILTLAAPAPTTAERYGLYRASDEIGQVATLVGYGAASTGASGQVSTETTTVRRFGQNKLDATFDQLSERYGNEMAWRPERGAQLAADFDNGLSANDGFGRLLGLSDLGVGEAESLISSGDSGGPLFIGGEIAGIASYNVRLDVAMLSPDIDSVTNASFGEFAAWQRVSQYQQWIDQSLRANYPDAPSKPEDVKKSVPEGSSGTSHAYFLLTFTGMRANASDVLSVDYTTRDGTATAGQDYLAVSGTLKLYAGENQAVIPVEILGDTQAEGDETFYLDVTNPVGGSFGEGVVTLTAVRTILNDDGVLV